MRIVKYENGHVARGVWVAPWMGVNGEAIIVAVARDGRRIAERELKAGDDHVGAGDALWVLLERADPMPQLKVI